MIKLFFIIALTFCTSTIGKDFEDFINNFPEIEGSVSMDKVFLSKCFYTKYHPDRDLHNLRKELKRIETKYLNFINEKGDDTEKYLFYYYGKIKKDSFNIIIYYKTDTSITEVTDYFILQTISKQGALIDKIIIGEVKSPYPEKNEFAYSKLNNDTLHIKKVLETYEDLQEPPKIEVKYNKSYLIGKKGKFKEFN